MRTRLTATVAVAALGLAACGGDNGDAVRAVTVTAPAESEQATSADGDAILIRTHISSAEKHAGVVLAESFLGDSRFCPGGKVGGGGAAPIVETFTCRDGSLKVQFHVTQPSEAQSAVWEIVNGTGRYKGLHGGGSMAVRFTNQENGGETFTGTVGKD